MRAHSRYSRYREWVPKTRNPRIRQPCRKHAILGFIFDVQSRSISLPEPELEGAQVSAEEILRWGAAIMLVETTRQLRGRMDHFRPENATWAILATPVDPLVSHGDEDNDWVTCHNVETWNALRHSMPVIETCMSDNGSWSSLSTGSLLRLLPIAERLSLQMESKSSIWNAFAANLDIAGGISWRGREFPGSPLRSVNKCAEY